MTIKECYEAMGGDYEERSQAPHERSKNTKICINV